MKLSVSLQDEADDVTQQTHLPLRESKCQELLLSQAWFIMELVPQHLETGGRVYLEPVP